VWSAPKSVRPSGTRSSAENPPGGGGAQADTASVAVIGDAAIHERAAENQVEGILLVSDVQPTFPELLSPWNCEPNRVVTLTLGPRLRSRLEM